MTDSVDDSNKVALLTADNCLVQAAGFVGQNLFEKAIPMYEKALSILERTYGEDQPELDDCLNHLAFCFENSKRLNDALRVHARRLRTQEANSQSGGTSVETLLKMAQINETLLRPADALLNIQHAVELSKQNLSSADPLYAHIMQRYQDMSSMVEMQAHAGSAAPVQMPASPVQLVEPIQVPGSETALSDWEEEAAADHSFDKYREAAANEDLVELARLNANRFDRDQGTKRSRSRVEGNQGFSPARLLHFAMPVIGLLTVLGLAVFFLMRKPEPVAPAVTVFSLPPAAVKIINRYRTADGTKEIRLNTNQQAVFVGTDKTVAMPYGNFVLDWQGLLATLSTAPKEKQIWADLKGSILRTTDDDIYYAADGPEVQVIAKMKRLAGFAQGYYLRCGEYPKAAANDPSGQLAYLNPVDSKTCQIALRAIPETNNEGVDALKTLQAGQLTPDETPYTPCQITCYAVQTLVDTARGQKVKATRFYVRGCDATGAILSPGQSGKYFLVTAGDEYLAEPKPAKSQIIKSPLQKLDKPTKFWIAANPPCPLSLLHFLLPIGLAILTIVLFVFSQMKAVNMKGKTITSGSKVALYLAVAVAVAAMAVLYLQLCVLA